MFLREKKRHRIGDGPERPREGHAGALPGAGPSGAPRDEPVYAKKTASGAARPFGWRGSTESISDAAPRTALQCPGATAKCSFLVDSATSVGCLFFPLFVTVSFIVLLARKVAALIPRSSDAMRISAQLLACTPFLLCWPCPPDDLMPALQILFSAYRRPGRLSSC